MNWSDTWDRDHWQRASTWYVPGDWALPDWWTNDLGVDSHTGEKYSIQNYRDWVNGDFAKNQLGSKGHLTLPDTITYAEYMAKLYKSMGL